ncbi:MAG: hypothetical protein LBE92_00255 [Chryseobacterium sp.]|jgi:hypothetical protein|uniref:hypothetical protein n=1 Tax=Chryseobacterium sp. TaxID=1871047 RepID=UPI00281D4825|nr:hypothetical protein [Chryseobacterium sp.]MDR2234529.1 hypothetical protein [Chryseobacterium sp.]
MKVKLIFSLLIFASLSFSAQTKEELKKKYEDSNLNQETDKMMKTQNAYPDSIILPPLHYTNSFYTLKEDIPDFESISIDLEIGNDVPKDYYFYIAPLNLEFNNIPIYCGIQSKGDGISSKTGKQENYIPFNGIFSRWYERDRNALKTDGYFISSDGEGDFISVRNPVNWNKGSYRITIKKDGYIPGKALPQGIKEKDMYFTWGDYEHTWLTMTVEDLKSHKTITIGSLAFPGKKIRMNKNIVSFLEQYRYIIDFAAQPRFKDSEDHIYYKDIPYIRVIQKNILINGKPAHFEKVKTLHNNTHHPDQDSIKGKMPILSKDQFNAETNELILETGILNPYKK